MREARRLAEFVTNMADMRNYAKKEIAVLY
jgi:hypothetical protein